MWTLVGLAVVLIAAVRSGSYTMWLWGRGERKAAIGVVLLTAFSVGLPIYAAVKANV
jgi:hypothetical protein